jgi:AraC-like DNA-binding protein
MIYYAVSGSGSFTFDGVNQPFIKNHLYIFPANMPVSLYNNVEDEFKLLFVHVYINPVPTKLIHLDLSEDKFLEHNIKLLRMYIKKPDKIYTQKLTEMLVSYLMERHDVSSSISREIKSYIERNYLEVYKNSDLSSVFNYSNSHIIKIFKDEYNTTPRKYALKLLLQHILALLKEGQQINQIAATLDFSSPENFSKFFKKNFGNSPSEVAKSLKRQNTKFYI